MLRPNTAAMAAHYQERFQKAWITSLIGYHQQRQQVHTRWSPTFWSHYLVYTRGLRTFTFLLLLSRWMQLDVDNQRTNCWKLRFQRLLYCSGILGQETSGKQVVDPCVGIDFRSICITVDMALSYLMCEKRGQGVRLQMSLMIEASLHMRGSLGKEEVRPSQDVALHQQAEVSPGPGFHFSQELLKSHSSREGVCLRHMDLSSPSVSLF